MNSVMGICLIGERKVVAVLLMEDVNHKTKEEVVCSINIYKQL